MSQAQVEEREKQANLGLNLTFFDSISGFFARNPRAGIWFLRVMTDYVSEEIGRIEGLNSDIYYFLGRTKAVVELLWDNDGHKIVQSTMTNPEVLKHFLEAIALLARVYNTAKDIKDNKDNKDINIAVLTDLMDRASSTLYGILKTVIDNAEEKTC
jgi:hypothetical protein